MQREAGFPAVVWQLYMLPVQSEYECIMVAAGKKNHGSHVVEAFAEGRVGKFAGFFQKGPSAQVEGIYPKPHLRFLRRSQCTADLYTSDPDCFMLLLLVGGL